MENEATTTTNTTTKPATNVAVLHPNDVELRARARAVMDRDGLTLRSVASKLNVSHRALKRWLDGAASVKEASRVASSIKQWLDGSRSAAPARDEVYVETRSSKLVTDALSYTKAMGKMACIYGGPGVGKTCAIRQFKRVESPVWSATMNAAITTVVPVLEHIAEAVGLPEPSGGARRIHQAICRQVADLGGILVIDEAQHLRTAAIEAVRSIHDETGVAIALVGNENVYAAITGGSRQAHFAQIYSRIGMRVPLTRPKLEDVRTLVGKRWGVKDDAVIAELAKLAAHPGGLRSVTQIVSACAKLGKVTVEAVRANCRVTGQEL